MDFKEVQYLFLQTAYRFNKLSNAELCTGLTPQEHRILEVIYYYPQLYSDHAGIRGADLANMLDVSPPAISRMLQSMERKELIRKKPDPKNRRNTFIHLTDKGESLRQEAEKGLSDVMEKMKNRIGAEKAETFLQDLFSVADIFFEEVQKIATEKTTKGENR